jgi:hypothetical protein
MFVAFSAIKLLPETRFPTFGIHHPGPDSKRRIVPDMLVMTAFQLGTPGHFIVEIETGDGPLHFCAI